MKTITSLNSNERSIGIELLHEANTLFEKNDWGMKKAAGELSLKTINAKDGRNKTLFPDVIIFADKDKLKPIMGWELKMPDVTIDNQEFLIDAKTKADRLGTSVFVQWNFQFVHIYIKSPDGKWPVSPTKIFNNYSKVLTSRAEVEDNTKEWKQQLFDVLSYLNNELIAKKFSAVPIEFNISNFVEDISKILTPITTTHFLSIGDERFNIYMKVWYSEEKMELAKTDEKPKLETCAEAFAKTVIIKWINRFIFAHLFKKNSNLVNDLLVSFDENKDINLLKNNFNKVVEKTDFFTIFFVDKYDANLPDDVVYYLIDFNLYLSQSNFSKVDAKFTSNILENLIKVSKRELMGLYTTPQNLAQYLVGITLEDTKGSFADFTAGSGTIAKFLMQKISKNQSIEYAHNHVWISDKYNFPLQIANFSITSEESMNYKNIVFCEDAFNIKTGDNIEIVNPSTGTKEKIKIPEFKCIISNLPFISSNNRKKTESNSNNKKANQAMTNLIKKYKLDKKCDLYQPLLLKYSELLKKNETAKIGVITSNSWFKTQKNYNSFYKILNSLFNVEFIVISNKGRWFNNAEVVTSIIVLKNKLNSSNNSENNKHEVKFISLNKNLIECNSDEIESLIQQTIIDSKTNNKDVNIQKYTNKKVIEYINLGMSLESLFCDIEWMHKFTIIDKLICLKNVFNIKRGTKTGNDKFFIIKESDVDSQDRVPFLKNIKHVHNYETSKTNTYLFYTKDPIEQIKKDNREKTLEYIEKKRELMFFKKKKTNLKNQWFQPEQTPQYGNFITLINPDKRFCWIKIQDNIAVNQRLVIMELKKCYKNNVDNADNVDNELFIHALLNSIISIFLLISSGFGRALGATDLTKDAVEQSYFLNPNYQNLKKDSKKRIINSWKKIKDTEIKDIFDQLNDKDWEDFNKTVLKEFNIDQNAYEKIKNSILTLVNRRLNSKNID